LLISDVVVGRRDAVEKDVAADDVNADGAARLQKSGDYLVELAQFLRDHRVAGRVRAGEFAQAGEAAKDRERIER
jgi:hypothetical protein